MTMWMSSRSQFSGTPFASYSAATRSSPSAIAAASSVETMPCAPSMATCAFDAAMSCRHSALSNGIEALISRMIALGPSAKRPPHIALESVLSLRLSLTLLLSAGLVAGCSKEEPAPPQEKAASQARGTLTGEIDRSHAGDLLPAIALVDPAGKALNSGALSGKPVLLNLWATWCAPCVEEMPLLDAVAGDYDGKLRVVVASQDLQGAEKVVPFFEHAKFAHLKPWLDRENALSDALGGDGVLPTTVLYDASGLEVARVVGGYDWSSPAARALLDEVIGG